MLDGVQRWLFDPSGLTPHGYCLLWNPGLVWLHAVSDAAIGLAYFTIPFTLGIVVRKRRDLVFWPVTALFAAFIFLCGIGHWLNLLTLWVPAYGIEGVVKGLTAVASLVTALTFWLLLPRALSLPSPAQLHQANQALLEREQTEIRLVAAVKEASLERESSDRANQAKSRFLAAISHELRTPLNGILGYAQLLQIDGGLNPVQSSRIEAMLGAGRHLLDMIGHVLTISEIEASSVDKRLSALRLEDIASNCLAQVRPMAEAKGLSLRLSAGPDAPNRVMIDAPRLRQILLNLLANAVKYTPAGRVELRLLPAGPGGLRIEVADTGPGIPAAKRHLLFHDFERLGMEAKTADGTGLGLAISVRLANLMGGRMGHADNPGGGSIFWLEVPDVVLAPDALASDARAPDLFAPGLNAEDEPGSMSAGTRQSLGPLPRLRILVVDDVDMNLDIARGFLQASGHEVVCASGGLEAVRLAASEHFDLMLMDVCMPEMDGIESTRRIRALPGARGRIPIVALTAQAFAEQVEECRIAGMNWHLAKPFTQSTLLDVIARANAVGSAQTPIFKAPAWPGADLPLFNARTFDHIGLFLDAEKLAKHAHTLLARCIAYRDRLMQPDALLHGEAELVSSAHALAGSALMLGYDRAGHTARLFENALRADLAEAAPLSQHLIAVLNDTIGVMQANADDARYVA
jgi:signal transduction histidine kinase/CheY-like chemotaxis protein/HPt (histidine-containing phosphotransfer) domain-containing protein